MWYELLYMVQLALKVQSLFGVCDQREQETERAGGKSFYEHRLHTVTQAQALEHGSTHHLPPKLLFMSSLRYLQTQHLQEHHGLSHEYK